MKLSEEDITLMAINMATNAALLTQSLIKSEDISADQAKDIAITCMTHAITVVLAIEGENERGLASFASLCARTIAAARETLESQADNPQPDQEVNNLH